MLRRRLLVLSVTALPAAPALAQGYWGDPRERQMEYERHREEQWRDEQRRRQWEEARERQMWEERRREELRREYEGRGRPPGDRY